MKCPACDEERDDEIYLAMHYWVFHLERSSSLDQKRECYRRCVCGLVIQSGDSRRGCDAFVEHCLLSGGLLKHVHEHLHGGEPCFNVLPVR
jgi:hypothetical protein